MADMVLDTVLDTAAAIPVMDRDTVGTDRGTADTAVDTAVDSVRRTDTVAGTDHRTAHPVIWQQTVRLIQTTRSVQTSY